MARNHEFTIGWISPLALEKEAARLVFDEVYPENEVYDQTTYYLGGRIGHHKVVIGVQSRIGLSGATSVAGRMRAAFPNIKYYLLVGIAGGVPQYGPAGDTKEIVLGDVVVSYPGGNHGGVLQYDKGAWQGGGRLNLRGHTNGVDSTLLNAAINIRAHGLYNTGIPEILEQMRSQLDHRRYYQYDDPGADHDRLFFVGYEHQGDENDDCDEVCSLPYALIRDQRGMSASRERNEPFVHYGTIASSNQLQISGQERDRIHRSHGAICFEMEAAGVMNDYPCIVIRGICDYADSHKNKGWQNYAAATAAAYAKALLYMVPAG